MMSQPTAAFQLAHVRPPNYVHAEALTELVECVYYGLRRLGITVFHGETPDRPARPILFGAHLIDAPSLAGLPSDSIIYNSEQMGDDSLWEAPYWRALRERTVWDYSSTNVEKLLALGARSVQHVPVGYVPELARVAPVTEDIDVLFYGSMNERREKIINALKARGLKVMTLFGVYGKQRDRWIARAKVILNIHYYDAKIFEIVRAAYLFTNSKALVTECDFTTAEELQLREAMCGVPYESLVDTCERLVRDPAERLALGQRGHEIFSGRREEQILAGTQEVAAAAEGRCSG
jgi:hypothetical protein